MTEGRAEMSETDSIGAQWNAALADYQAKRAHFDKIDRSDEALDAYCAAMDRLVATRAPDGRALQMKLELIEERNEDAFDDYRLLVNGFASLKRDAAMLAGGVV